jgi:hypothetical protein
MRRRAVVGYVGSAFGLGIAGCVHQSDGGDAIISAKPVDSVRSDGTIVEYSGTWLREASHFARAIQEVTVDDGKDIWHEIPRSEGKEIVSRVRSEYPGEDDEFPYFVRYEGIVVRISVLFEG